MVAATAVLALAVVAGLIMLWPTAERDGPARQQVPPEERAEVVRVDREACQASQTQPCQIVRMRLESGPDAGREVQLTLPGTDLAPELEPGDVLRVQANEGALEPYALADVERRTPLLVLALVFGALVVALGRMRGLLSLAGLGLSLLVVLKFMVPAILDGRSPVATGLVGALAVMLVSVFLAHGLGVKSMAAVLGAATSLVVTAVLAWIFVRAAHISGFSSGDAMWLNAAGGTRLSLEGLVLAGMIVGALGVLDDVTISQASTVMALRRANPALSAARLLREGLQVGRDHLTATVNTLVLAYVGAALPALLIFETRGTSAGDALNSEAVAGTVVAMLVGSIGLILAVPLTTALAAILATRVPAETLPDELAHHH